MMKPFKTVSQFLIKRGVYRKRKSRASDKRDSQPPFSLDWLKIGLVTFTIAALSLLMSVHLMPDKIALRLGDISPTEVRAPRSVIYVNSTATARLQQAAMLGIRPLYDTDETAASNANRIVKEFFDRIALARADRRRPGPPVPLAQTASDLQAQLGSLYSIPQIKHLLAVSPALLEKLRDTTTRLVADAMDREIRNQGDDLERAHRDVTTSARSTLSSEDAALVGAVAEQAIRPNRLLNRHKTEEAQEKAARAITPVYEPIQRGDRLIATGERVTQEHLDKFTALGLLNPRLEITTGAAACVLAAAMVFLVVFYISRTLPTLYTQRKRLALLALIVLLSVFGIKVSATMLGLQFSSGQLGYLGMASVAAAGMLVSVLLDRNLAVMIVALLSVQSGLIMNHEIRFTVMTLMSSLVGIVSVENARAKNNLLTITAALAGANLALVWLLGLLLRDSMPELLTGSAWAAGAAVFAVFLYWFGVLAMEKPFGILTHATLLELSSFDRPLLRQLCAVAPGTYAHSIMVGTLAEAGAQAIGADSLLCRVAGYYHDIGKSKHPEFFVENQRRENVHGRLSPSLSALIIMAHVRDGVEMAKQHRLPDEIRDIIAQHHGTTLISYFYHQALTDVGGNEEVAPGLEERFRYPGPKPQTREAALVMVADSVEAAARCQERPRLEQLEVLIANITRGKIEDGQLDECELTFQDLKRISDAFLHVLSAMMHGRIDYPQQMPRTASGRPMEVSRPDLHAVPALPMNPASVDPDAALFADSPDALDPETNREIAAHLKAHESADAIHAVNYDSSEESSPSRAMPLIEPEVFYGPLSTEYPSTSDTNDRAAPGGSPPAPRRGAGPSRS